MQAHDDVFGNRQKAVDGHGSELDATLSYDLLHGHLGAERVAIRPLRSHGVVGVTYGHDLRHERNLIPGQPLGVPPPIPTLVMVPDARSQVLERGDRLQDLRSVARMCLDIVELLFGEPAVLREDPQGYGQLAQVVQVTDRPKRRLEVALEAQRVGDSHREHGDPSRVPRGVGVLRVDQVRDDGEQLIRRER